MQTPHDIHNYQVRHLKETFKLMFIIEDEEVFGRFVIRCEESSI
jgi:hypothetical protein